MIASLLNFDYTEADMIFKKYIIPADRLIQTDLVENMSKILDNKTFVITGKTKLFKNRDELKSKIEEYGGKVSNSVSSKTNYLINNDTTSQTSKNLTAIKLHIPIISEDEFLTLITPPNENIEPSYINSAT